MLTCFAVCSPLGRHSGVIGASSVPTIWDLYYSCFQRPRASIGGYRGLRHHLKIFSAFIGPDQRSGDAI